MARANSSDPGDLTGRVVLITGATSGIGREAAVRLAAMGATVVMTGRDPQRSADALDDVRRRSGSDAVELVSLDLASFASIRACAAEVLDRWDRLDVLVANAGGIHTDRRETVEGYELTFGANHLGHHLLTTLLVDRLTATAARSDRQARVVVVASLAHRAALGGPSWAALAERTRYDGWTAYAESKLCNVAFTMALAERLAGTGVTATCCHPGTVRSHFGSADDASGLFRLGILIGRPFFVTPRRGASPLVALAVDPRYEGRTGIYVSGGYPPLHRSRPSRPARDPEVARRLWGLSEELVACADRRAGASDGDGPDGDAPDGDGPSEPADEGPSREVGS